MLILRHAKHLELIPVKSADDIKPEAAMTYMIRGGHLLGCKNRMDHGHMDGSKHGNLASLRQQAAGPGDRFKGRAVNVRCSAKTLPPRNGYHALEPGFVRKLRKLEVI